MAAGPLEVGADVIGGHAVQHGVDAGAIAIIREAGTRRAAHGCQAVFGQCNTRDIDFAEKTENLTQRRKDAKEIHI